MLNREEINSKTSSREVGWEVVTSGTHELKQVTVNGADFTYVEKGSGESVILVHGALCDYRAWSRQLDSLSHRFRVISYSRRYHYPNKETVNREGYSYERHADDLIQLIERLECKPANLIGHAYGGSVVVLAALKRPELVRSLVLCEPTLFGILSSPDDKISQRLHQISLHVVERMAQAREQDLAIREYMKIVTGTDSFDDLPLEAQLMTAQNVRTLAPMLRAYFDNVESPRDRARQITQPTFLVSGRLSPRLFSAINNELEKVLPHSRSLVLENTSHGLHMESPEEFHRAVMRFLCNKSEAIYG